ncbi:hypothetical protein ACLK1S_19795 [Escherichia coli]
MIGHARFNVPGTWRAGSDTMRGIPPPAEPVSILETHICRWLGLSRHNLIAPATMMRCCNDLPDTTMNLTLSPCCRLRAIAGSLQCVQVCIRRAWIGEAQRKATRCRGV